MCEETPGLAVSAMMLKSLKEKAAQSKEPNTVDPWFI